MSEGQGSGSGVVAPGGLAVAVPTARSCGDHGTSLGRMYHRNI